MREQPESAATARRGRWIIFAVAAVWVATLWGLMVVSANPVILNRVQILSSPLIVSGTRDPAKPAVLNIDRVWKGEKPADTIVVHDWPDDCPTGKLVVPLQFARMGNGFSITHGEWPNFPASGKPVDDPKDVIVSTIPPTVYPETEDVIRQLQALLGPEAAR